MSLRLIRVLCKALLLATSSMACFSANGALGATVEAGTPADVIGKCMTEPAYASVKDVLRRAAILISAKSYSDAIVLLDRGIAMVGDTYVMQDLIDDTGMKLTLAQIEEKKGAASRAATLKYGVLSARLETYGLRHECARKT